MKSFGVIRNTDKSLSEGIALKICDYLHMHGGECFVSESGTDLPKECECALVLGGDGTLLRAAKVVLDRQLPLLGINLGTLGYLAEIDVKNLNAALDRLLLDEFSIEKRMMLSGTVYHRGEAVVTDTALNEISLNRLKSLRTYRFLNYVNGELLTSYSSDGVIVATATGSTGYSLSVGGPIVSPSAEMMLMTPVAPHSLISRSIILPPEDCIRVEIGAGRTGIESGVANVWFDGVGGIHIGTGDTVEICRSDKYTNIIKISHISFIEVLRKKMADS